ncbi:MAG: hypothetical protein HLUCCO17_04540, partial [Saliniramus fredricksonii]
GVSFLLEVLAGFSTRHDTPPPQTASPRFAYSSPPGGGGADLFRNRPLFARARFTSRSAIASAAGLSKLIVNGGLLAVSSSAAGLLPAPNPKCGDITPSCIFRHSTCPSSCAMNFYCTLGSASLREDRAQFRHAGSHGHRIHCRQRSCQRGSTQRPEVQRARTSFQPRYPPAPEGPSTKEGDDFQGSPSRSPAASFLLLRDGRLHLPVAATGHAARWPGRIREGSHPLHRLHRPRR